MLFDQERKDTTNELKPKGWESKEVGWVTNEETCTATILHRCLLSKNDSCELRERKHNQNKHKTQENNSSANDYIFMPLHLTDFCLCLRCGPSADTEETELNFNKKRGIY